MSNLVNRSVRKRCFHRGKYSFGKGGIYFSGVWKLFGDLNDLKGKSYRG
jgi:hypothetical protein